MNGLPYYKRYPRDFIEGTVGMTFELKAAYGLILDLIYMQGGQLPDDPRYISGLLSTSVRRWNGFRNDLILLGKIGVCDGFLTNDRAIIELESLRSFADNQSKKARKPRKSNNLRQPGLSHTDTEPEEKPRGFSKRASAPKKSDLDLIREAFDHA